MNEAYGGVIIDNKFIGLISKELAYINERIRCLEFNSRRHH